LDTFSHQEESSNKSKEECGSFYQKMLVLNESSVVSSKSIMNEQAAFQSLVHGSLDGESFTVVAVTICLIVSYYLNSSLYKCYNFLEGAEMSGTSMHSSSVSIHSISLSRYWGAYKKFNVSRRGMVRHIRFET